MLRDLDVLIAAMMLRRQKPHLVNFDKRLVKLPKVNLHDNGLLHALLNIQATTDLQGHPIAGASWKGFVVEPSAALALPDSQNGFYRTPTGAAEDVEVLPLQALQEAVRDRGCSARRDAWAARCRQLVAVGASCSGGYSGRAPRVAFWIAGTSTHGSRGSNLCLRSPCIEYLAKFTAACGNGRPSTRR